MKNIFIILLVYFALLCVNTAYSQVELKNYKNRDVIGIKKILPNDSLELTTFENEKFTLSKYEYLEENKLISNIKLTSGLLIVGEIVNFSNDNFYVMSNNELKTVPASLIDNISFTYTSTMDTSTMYTLPYIFDSTDSTNSKRNNLKIGFALGTPGGLNLLLFYQYTEKFGTNLIIGGATEEIFGFQIDNYYTLYYDKNFSHNIGIPLGYMNSFLDGKDGRRVFTGLAYHLNLYFIYTQIGINFDIEGFKDPRPLLQIGIKLNY